MSNVQGWNDLQNFIAAKCNSTKVVRLSILFIPGFALEDL